MSQENNILRKIKGLVDKAQNTDSIHEAETFMIKAQELLQKYNLDMSQVQSHTVENGITEDVYKYQYVWELYLMMHISTNNFCKMYYTERNSEMHLVGKTENIGIVIYMFNFFRATLLRLSLFSYSDNIKAKKELFKKMNLDFDKMGDTKSYKNQYLKDYMDGGVAGVGAKLSEQKKEASQNNNQLSGIMVISGNDIAQYLQRKGVMLSRGNIKNKGNGTEGYGNGYKDGKNINLAGGLGAGNSKMIR